MILKSTRKQLFQNVFLTLMCALVVGCASHSNGNTHENFDSSSDVDTDVDSDTVPESDCGIEVLYENNFDKNTTGTYEVDEWSRDWNSPPWDNNITYNFYGTIQETDLGNSMEVLYPQADGTMGGVKWRAPLGETYEEAYFSYDIRFSENWDGSADGGKLPGICGGTCPSGGLCEGGPCNAPTTGFSIRLMFNSGQEDSVHFYNYYNNKSVHFGPYCPEPYDAYNCRYGASLPWNVDTTPGTWHTVTMRVVMNSPGEENGIFEGFFDGVLVASQVGVIFRPAGETFHIDQMMFETFFGGGTGPIKDETMQYDNVRLFRYLPASGETTGQTPSSPGRVLEECQ